MELTLEELFDLAETVSEAIGIPFVVLKGADGAWHAHFEGISKRDNVFNIITGPHKTVKEALIAVLKAVKPKE